MVNKMKKIILILIILIIFTFMLCGCSTPEDRDLKDGVCNACGGKWHYKETSNFLSTQYVYKCDYCGKELYTHKWWGKS